MKDVINTMESHEQENIFSDHINFNGLVSGIYKEPLKLNNKQTADKWKKIWTLYQGRYTDGKEACKKMLDTTNLWRNIHELHKVLLCTHWNG